MRKLRFARKVFTLKSVLRRSSYLLGFAVTFALCGSAISQTTQQSAIEVPLQWQSGQIGAYAGQDITLTAEVPAGMELPEDVSAEVQFSTLTLGDSQKLHLAFEFGAEQDRIWVDGNFNQSFADGDPYSWTKTPYSWTQDLEVMVSFDGEVKPVPIPLQLRCNPRDLPNSLTYITQAYKTGAAVLGQRKRRITIHDESSRLDWSAESGVVCLIDMNGDGRLAAQHGSPEHFHPGDRIQFGTEAWRFLIPEHHGARLLLMPCSPGELSPKPIWQPAPKPNTTQLSTPSATPLVELIKRYEQEKEEPIRTRRLTVQEMGLVGSQEAFNVLLQISNTDTDWSLRAAAVRAMGRTEFLQIGADALVALTACAQTPMVEAAIASLYRMEYPELEGVLHDLCDSDRPKVAGQAVTYLSYLGTAEALQTVERLLNHTQGTVRYLAYQGLRCLEHGPSLGVMVAAATDGDTNLSALALLDLLAMQQPEARTLAIAAAERQPSAVAAFADAVLTVLLASGDKASIQAVFEMAEADARGTFASKAVTRLSSLRSKEALSMFGKILRGKSKQQRLLASKVFAQIGGELACEPLSKQLKRERDRLVVESLLLGLGQSDSRHAIPILIAKAKRRGPQRLPAISALTLNGFKQHDARAFLLGLLNSRYWQDRVLVVDGIGNSGDRSLALSVVPALEDEEWQVRLAAIDTLRKLRSADWVEPLVLCLQVEERLRLQKAIGQTLFVITGQSPYMDAASWSGWWLAARSEFEMSEEIPQPHKSSSTISRGFYGLTLDSDSVVFVIDKSGSMSAGASADAAMKGVPGDRLDQALANASVAMEALPDHAKVNVVMFGSGVETWQTSLTLLKKKNRKDLQRFFERQNPRGGTDLFDGLETALLQEGVDRIMLLSDGHPGGGRFVTTIDILREVRRLNQTNRIAIDCVSLGMKSELLKQIAEENGGRYIER